MVGRKEQVRNLAMEELIGRKVRIREHSMIDIRGLEGIVLDETRNTLVIRSGERCRTVPKRGSVLEFADRDDRTTVLDGDDILFRPEDRIKRCDKITIEWKVTIIIQW
jgi:ribonuclease P protein subunit POP4